MRYFFPVSGNIEEDVLNEIEKICSKDFRFKEGRILSSICSEPLPIAINAFCRFIHTNLGDPNLFPGIKEMERAVTEMIGDLLACSEAVGNCVSGGTEANLLALFAAKKTKKNNIASPEVIAPFSSHFSLEKVASIIGLTICYTKLTPAQRADVEDIEHHINRNTIAIIATAGTSELGAVDPISEIASLAERHGLYFHVDAASGGFIIPFARDIGYNLPQFDFSIPAVDSITIDPHKFGLTVIPSGWILFRSIKIQKSIEFESHYVDTLPHTTFTGTRPGAAVASTFAVIKYLGRHNFRKIVKEYFQKRDFLINELKKYGLELLIPPDLNIIAIKSKNPAKAARILKEKRWMVSLSKRYNALRVVIHHHLQKAHLSSFVKELYEIEKSLESGEN